MNILAWEWHSKLEQLDFHAEVSCWETDVAPKPAKSMFAEYLQA
jgi:hypothetical protein